MIPLRTTSLLTATLGLLLWSGPTLSPAAGADAGDDDGRRGAIGSVAAQFVGRLVGRADGSAEVIGYFPSITAIGRSLFAGPPGEATASFTMRSTPVRLAATLTNGPLGHVPVTSADDAPILFHVYLDTRPDQDFAHPDTFSNGRLIASFSLPAALVTSSPSSTAYVGTLELERSDDFAFAGRRWNLRRLVDAITIHLDGAAPIVGRGGGITVPFGATIVAARAP